LNAPSFTSFLKKLSKNPLEGWNFSMREKVKDSLSLKSLTAFRRRVTLHPTSIPLRTFQACRLVLEIIEIGFRLASSSRARKKGSTRFLLKAIL